MGIVPSSEEGVNQLHWAHGSANACMMSFLPTSKQPTNLDSPRIACKPEDCGKYIVGQGSHASIVGLDYFSRRTKVGALKLKF